ncbi:MAG TPA: AAA family ATPase [Blastocatellia bacterium]|nr:AAA family ATPase [Blastocatellia bacterium]
MGKPVLSRVAGGAFLDRRAQLDKLCRAATGPGPRTVLVLGPPQSGKTELLRTTFDLLFGRAHLALPVCFQPHREQLSPEKLARSFLFTLIQQYLAFIRRQPELIAATELTTGSLYSLLSGDEDNALRALLDGYEMRLGSGNQEGLLRYVFDAPLRLAAQTPHRLVLMFDDAQLLNQVCTGGQTFPLLNEKLQEPPAISLVITGLQRALLDQLSFGRELLSELWFDWLEPLDLPTLQALLDQWCAQAGVSLDHETGRLAIQQLDGNLLYLRALVTAAAERQAGLGGVIEFERLYVNELLRGRIAHHFSTLLRRIARETAISPRGERAATEIVSLCYEAIESRAPVEEAGQRLGRSFHTDRLLTELHHHELITLLDDHILPAEDPVFRDWLSATQQRFAGVPVSRITLDLLSRRIKAAPQTLVRSELRSLQSRLIDLLARFDRQSIARSLVVQDEFLARYGSASYSQIFTGLSQETERIALPQIIYAAETPLPAAGNAGTPQPQPPWSCIIAYGFDEAICDNDHETIWMIALNSSPAAITESCVAALDEYSGKFGESCEAGRSAPRVVRWAISRMGFTAEAVIALRERGFLTSDYLQLDLLAETLDSAPRAERATAISVEIRRPETRHDFDLAIPLGEDREIIAARVAEQMARSAGFAPEELNQLKTALIEACLSLSAIGPTPDGRLYQRFHADHERVTISVASSAAALNQPGGVLLENDPEGVWRMNVLRSLVDEVTLTRLVGGFRVTLTKRKSAGRS